MTISEISIGGIPGQGGGGVLVGVPDLVGKTRATAEADLASLGLRSRVEDVETLGTPGDVYDQNPKPPRTVRKGSEIRLQVIKAPVTPPDLGAKLDAIQAATDQIVAVKAATDQIAAIKAATDQIAAIKAATDQIAALETDATAAARNQQVSAQLTDILNKLKDIEGKVGVTTGGGGTTQQQAQTSKKTP